VVRQVRPAHSNPRFPDPSNSCFDNGEFLIDTSNALSPAPFNEGSPALAFDGENFLVVWEDGRNGSDIYGARVTPAGVVLDTAGIAISTAAGNQGSPALAFDGENFLVVWQDGRSGFGGDIYGARVTPTGVVLDQQGIAVSTAVSQKESPTLAFDGENFLVAWTNQRSGDYSDIYGARVTPAGVVLDTVGIAISTAEGGQESPSLAFDGENFLVVWEDARSDSYWDIYGARVTPAGVVLDPAGIAISTAAVNYELYPAVAFDGENFTVVWQDDRNDSVYVGYYDIYGTRVTPAGVVLDTAGIAVSAVVGGQESPALAFDGEDLVVAWTDGRNGSNADIYGTRVTPAGVVLDTAGIAFSTVVGSQESPALAFDGANFLVAWQDERSGSSDVYGARVTPTGVVLDPAGIAIATAAGNQGSPALAFDGANFLVVWLSGSTDIYGARVTPAGVVLDTAGIAISTAEEQYEGPPTLAFDGDNFLVAWTAADTDHVPINYGIYGARVTQAGVALDTARIAISTRTYYQEHPALAFDGENFLVVWQDQRSGSDDIYGARVTPAGAVLDTAGIAISAAADSQSTPALAWF